MDKISSRFLYFRTMFLMSILLNACMQLTRSFPSGEEIFRSSSLSLDRPIWSKDGTFLALSGFNAKDGKNQVIIMNTNTLQTSEIFRAPRTSVESWSPLSSDELLVASDGEIKVIDIETSREITPITTGTKASWSPDGKLIAIVDREKENRFIKIWGFQQEMEISRTTQIDFVNVFDISWSGDGKQLLLSAIDTENEITIDVFVYDLEENSYTQITSGVDGEQNINPIWINQSKILYLQKNIFNDEAFFVIYDLTTGCEEKIAVRPISSFSISPDKKRLVSVIDNHIVELSATSFILEKLSSNQCE